MGMFMRWGSLEGWFSAFARMLLHNGAGVLFVM
jgi:hypothetical protein